MTDPLNNIKDTHALKSYKKSHIRLYQLIIPSVVIDRVFYVLT